MPSSRFLMIENIKKTNCKHESPPFRFLSLNENKGNSIIVRVIFHATSIHSLFSLILYFLNVFTSTQLSQK